MKRIQSPLWHSKTYIRFVISFCLIVVLITLAFSLFLRSTLLESVQRDLLISSQAAVDQSAIYVDQLLTTTDTIVSTVANSRGMSAYRIEPTDINRIHAMSDLKYLRSFSQLIEDIYYLPLNDDYVLSAYSSYTDETFFRVYSRQHLTPELLHQYMTQPYLPLISFPDTLSSEVHPSLLTDVISTIYPLPFGGSGKYALLMVDVNREKLQSILTLNLHDGHVFLFNQENTPLVASSSLELTPDQLSQLAQHSADAVPTFAVDAKNYYVFTSLLNHNWRLVCLKPERMVIQNVNLQQARYLGMSIGSLLIGLLFSLLLSMWNYLPIAELKQKVNSTANKPQGAFSDDIKEIAQELTHIVTQKDHLATRLENNRMAICARHVFSLINNRMTSDDAERLAADGLTLRHANYVVAIYAPRLNAPIRQEGGWIAQFSAATPAAWDAYFLEYQASKLYVGLISLPPAAPDVLAAEFETIQRSLPAPVSISVSAPTQDLFNLTPAFIQAQNNLQQRFFLSEQMLFIHSEASPDAGGFNYPHNQLHKLELALASKHEESCIEALNQLFSDIRDSSITMDTLYCICFQVSNQIIRQLEVNHVPLEHVEVLLPNILHITHNETLDELEEQIRQAVESALEAMNHRSEPETSKVSFEEILEYIEQNGCRSDFSVRMVVEHFSISNPCLNKLFREASGTTVNKYVQSMRITQARQLLVDTELPLADIVEQVGYIDLSSFIKRFKQETGMTPMTYRKLYR